MDLPKKEDISSSVDMPNLYLLLILIRIFIISAVYKIVIKIVMKIVK